MEEAKDNNSEVASEEETAAQPEAASIPSDAEAATAAPADAPSDDAEPSAEDALAAAQAEVAEWKDKYMRLHAEWDTYRRRMNEQREEEKKRACEGIVSGLIPVLDDFERSIDYAANNGEAGLLDGVQKVHTKFADVLAKAGVEVIDPVGQAFNALEAQAVATVPNPDVPDETVQEVYQKGYKMGVKVIRPAMVTVATGGPAREKEE
ncbi:nucleotide exchange factor GrpE [Denitrobacterium detoxificans]|jgi:molecular chaperone GrpE|uniref:nucleotide exchange factor GrpE n=1 Tax=Denitrobacterium detoxificans TaxID=79604 RepID=UPI0026F2CCAD|nr:nucleotide exchange factor GrpE [Denitrobacterium detoxificans]MBE6466826.1 nucleotide exchange factor GrpE [Denitrobacterium detoxificans]